jgi:hypothetical protein
MQFSAVAVAAPRRRMVQFAFLQWAASSVGRAPRSQRGGREFEPPAVHQPSLACRAKVAHRSAEREGGCLLISELRLASQNPKRERQLRLPLFVVRRFVDKLWTNRTCRAPRCVVRASDACSARACASTSGFVVFMGSDHVPHRGQAAMRLCRRSTRSASTGAVQPWRKLHQRGLWEWRMDVSLQMARTDGSPCGRRLRLRNRTTRLHPGNCPLRRTRGYMAPPRRQLQESQRARAACRFALTGQRSSSRRLATRICTAASRPLAPIRTS